MVHCPTEYFFFKIKKTYFYLFVGCVGSSLLCGLFSGWGEWRLLSLWWLPLLPNVDSRLCRLSDCSTGTQQLWFPGSWAQAQQLSCMGLAVPQYAVSFQTRDQTCASCISRQILYHWATRKAPCRVLMLTVFLFQPFDFIL